jgi:hypothetical protein
MNEHIRRIHEGPNLTVEQFEKLETCQAWKPSEKSSFRAIARSSSLEVGVDFRMESLFESKVGLLGSNVVFFEGEEARIGADCLRYFRNHHEPNPFFQPVVAFLKTANTLCSRIGSELCRQQAIRNHEGVTTSACFRPVQLPCVHKYAANVAHFVYFATKCPWDYHQEFNEADVASILQAVFFEPRRSIQQNYITRYYCNYYC